MASNRSPISTHILDTSRGLPASEVEVSLYQYLDDVWTPIKMSLTDSDGRCSDLLESGNLSDGRFKLHFNTAKYFSAINASTIYPFIEITFDCVESQGHYHIPLLLNPFGYTTYRGT